MIAVNVSVLIYQLPTRQNFLHLVKSYCFFAITKKLYSITLAAKEDLGSCNRRYIFCFTLPVAHLSCRNMCSVNVISILSLIPYSNSWALSQNQQHLASLHSAICQYVSSSTTYDAHMLCGKCTVPLLKGETICENPLEWLIQ